MTIRMLQAWNGLHQQKIVTTLSGSDEAALVAAGIATYDLDGPAENVRMAQLATDAAGNVVGLGLTENRFPLQSTPIGTSLEIMPTSDVTMWNTDKTASLTVEIDNTVTFAGGPSLKVTIPAGTSGTLKIGTNLANSRVPYNWNRENFALTVMCSNWGAISGGLNAYFGDASYTNFWVNAWANPSNYPEEKIDSSHWWCVKPTLTNGWSSTGSPAVSQNMRHKIQWTGVSQSNDTYLWIGFFGTMPARKKPTIIWTLDDGYKSWDSFAAPLFRHYDMPCSMGIDSALTGTNNYLTASQIQTLFTDKSRLFDIVNHGVSNQSQGALGDAAYYQTLTTTRDYLRGLGIYGDGPLHHPYVQSLWSKPLADMMEAGGFLSARAASYAAYNGKDQLYPHDPQRWRLNICTNLQTGKTLAQAQADIQQVITDNAFGMINAHDFAQSAGAYIWDYGSMEQLVGWLAAQRDAGACEIKSWSRWYADLTGRLSDRR
jgi:peptidoglycan/xylan/chitin deacetylase (PgdA/CDA1 family)